MRPQAVAYFANLCCLSFARGVVIVTLAWAALSATDSLASVGQVFAVSHVVNMICAPFLGTLVDRQDRKTLLVIGQMLYGLGVLLPVAMIASGTPLALWMLFSAAGIAAVGVLLVAGCLDAIQQKLFLPERQRQITATAGGIRQAAMVAGSGAGGVLIHYLGVSFGFGIAALCALMGGVAALILPRAAAQAPNTRRYLSDLLVGVRELAAYPAIFRLALITALGFSVGQIGNALLAPFIKHDIGGSSDLYGLVDASWSIGGVASALLLAALLQKRRLPGAEYAASLALGLLTTLLYFTSSPAALVVVFALMGVLFSAARVLCDGRVLEICPNEIIGRVRGNTQSLVSLLGLVTYLSPTLLAIESPRTTFAVWGALVSLGVVLVYAQARATGTLLAAATPPKAGD